MRSSVPLRKSIDGSGMSGSIGVEFLGIIPRSSRGPQETRLSANVRCPLHGVRLRFGMEALADRQPANAQAKEERLVAWMRAHGSIAIGYSGGVDSAYLAAVAVEALGADHVTA